MTRETQRFYEFGPFRLVPGEYLLLRAGQRVTLPPKAFETLLVLVESHGHILGKDELLKRIWPDTFVEEVSLSKNVWALRKTLGDGEGGQSYIETVPRRGYRFVAEVREVGPAPGEPAADDDGLPSRQAESAAPATPPTTATSEPGRAGRWVRPAALLPSGLLLTLAVWAVWLVAHRQRAKTPAAPARTVPFTSFAGSESHPAFSPDGKQMAFVWGGESDNNNDIYVKLIGTETPLRLTNNPAADSGPTWSSDGRYIAFLRRSAEGSGFYLVPALGGAERKLAKAEGRVITEGEPARLAWHPGGEWLAVTDSNSPAEPPSIFLLSVETGEKRRLTSPPAHFFGDWNPAFSPDGKMLAFTRAVNGISLDIHIVAVSGGEPQRLTFDDAHLKSLAWTPDGREIVFSSSRGGSVNTATLWKIPAAGGTLERLTGIGQNAFTLAIDRQASRLAYEQRLHDTNIYQVDLSASTAREAPHTKLTSSTFQDNTPDYAPDGKRIAYVSDRTGSLEIWLCDGEGANPIQLTNIGGQHTGTPRWSPDGQWIVFDSGVEGNQEIFVINPDGGNPRRLTFDSSLDMMPSWARDGRWIYFTSNRSGDFQVWKVPSEGGQATQVTRQGGFEGFESEDGKFIYYSKGIGLPDIWRAPVEGGEETLILELEKTGHRRSWAIAEKGIYFAVAETSSSSAVEFFSLATGRVERRVAQLDGVIKNGPPGLTVSPGGRRLLYTRIDQRGSDIMLMENFR